MTALSRDDVAKVARLARLRLSDEELEIFTGQLSQVLAHAQDMGTLDLEGVTPTAHPFGLVNVVRADEPVACLDRAEVLACAPDSREGRFAVPRIVGEPA